MISRITCQVNTTFTLLFAVDLAMNAFAHWFRPFLNNGTLNNVSMLCFWNHLTVFCRMEYFGCGRCSIVCGVVGNLVSQPERHSHASCYASDSPVRPSQRTQEGSAHFVCPTPACTILHAGFLKQNHTYSLHLAPRLIWPRSCPAPFMLDVQGLPGPRVLISQLECIELLLSNNLACCISIH